MELVGGARVPEKRDLNANGNPTGKRPATRRDPNGIVAFSAETVEPSVAVRQRASQY